jgi:hypothetical protein
VDKVRLLSLYLTIFGILNLITALTIPPFFGDALLWLPRNIPTEVMMSSIYVAMSLIMLLTARNPMPHKAFVDFLIVANTVHALVMLIYAEHIWQIILDAGFIGATGLLPLLFYPWGLKKFLRY